MILRAVKVRLYPNKEQQTNINKMLGCYRFVYNHMLERKINAYNNEQKNLSLNDLSKYFFNELLKNEDYKWLKEQNSKVITQAIRQLMVAYKNFFESGFGFPKFKAKSEDNSATFNNQAISKTNHFESKHITLTKALKNLKFRCSNKQFQRIQQYKDNIRSATLSRTKTGKYFLSILFAMDDNEFQQFKLTGQKVGIDLGIKNFITTSDGQTYENKHFFTKSEKKIKKLHKQLSNKVKGSNNRKKARLKLAKAYEKQVNQRKRYIHELVNDLLRKYDYIFMEDLNVSGMMQNHNLAKAIQELGLYNFKLKLKDKALLNNKFVIDIDRWYPSSKLCHKCGYKYETLSLNERLWYCPKCKTYHNRDINAAINMLNEGNKIIGCSTPEFTLVDYPTMDDRCESNLKSSGRLKQEPIS